jgi:hypothetical protein
VNDNHPKIAGIGPNWCFSCLLWRGRKPVSASDSVDNTVRVRPVYPDAISAMCAKLTTNMSRQQCRDWVSPDIDYIKACPDLPITPD